MSRVESSKISTPWVCWTKGSAFSQSVSGVGLEPVQQPREGVMGRGTRRVRLRTSSDRTTDHFGGGGQELEVGVVGTARAVHVPIREEVNVSIK